ncbi:peptidase M36, partial [Mycena haematopus]
ESGIVVHELSHGLIKRLTGGLPFGESGGMGVGWGGSNFHALHGADYSDYAMGSWAANCVYGIRNYSYSRVRSATSTPRRTRHSNKPGYFTVHAIGEGWAQTLWVVSQGLIEKHGFMVPSAALVDGSIPTGDFYRPVLVLNATKLPPCRPGFFEARDAIILADQQLTGGENFCTLWMGFSSRGVGPDA